MKKLIVAVGVFCFLFASCCNKGTQPAQEDNTVQECTKGEEKAHCKEMTEEQKKECEAFKQKWENWDNLTDVEKKELVDKKKACFDKRDAEMKEKMAEMEAKKKAFDEQWANWDNLNLDEQKALLDQKSKCCKKKCGKEKSCHKETKCNKEEKKCNKEEK